MSPQLRAFLNNVVEPWDELNRRLALPYVYQRTASPALRSMRAIAVELRHTAELLGEKSDAIVGAPTALRLITDVADGAKHGGRALRDASLHHDVDVYAMVEARFAGQLDLRFLRNVLEISHDTFGQRDFMIEARNAMRYWLKRLGAGHWDGYILEGAPRFERRLILYYEREHWIGNGKCRIAYKQRDNDGRLLPVVAPGADVEILKYEYGDFGSLGNPVELKE